MNDERALQLHGLGAWSKPADIELGYIFIGSCTNARLSDLQLAARFVKGKKIAPNLTAIVVPGSRPVKRAAEKLGLDKVFLDAGFEWRDPGCSYVPRDESGQGSRWRSLRLNQQPQL